MDALAALEGLSQHVAPAGLVFCRIVGLLATAPFISGEAAPLRVKAGLALVLTVILYPVVDHPPPGLPGPGHLLALGRELGVGLSLGFFTNLFVHAVRFGGDLIGRSAGFAAAEAFNPDAGTIEGPVGQLFALSVGLLFFLMDGHLAMIDTLVRSYDLVPVGAWGPGPWALEAALVGIDQVFTIAVSFALPIEGAILAVTVAEGVIARAVPQINILMISFAIKILVTLLLLTTALPLAVGFLGVVLVTMHELGHGLLMVMGG